MSKDTVIKGMNNTNRVASWDNIKGILILLVVFGHMLFGFYRFPIVYAILKFIYFFHMPAFIFVSGYFGSSKPSLKSLLKLVFAYIVFNGLAALLFGYNGILEPVYSFWYIPALIIWRLTADKVNKIKGSVLVTIIVGLLIGLVSKVDNTLGIARVIAFYPFYLAGYKLALSSKKDEICKEFKSVKGLLALLVGILGSLIVLLRFDISLNATMMVAYESVLELFARLAIYGLATCFILGIIYIAPSKEVPFITSIGRNSLVVFLVHRFITLFVSKFLEGMNELLIVGISLVFSFILVFILGHDYIAGFVNRFLEMGAEILLNCKENLTRDRKHLLTGLIAIIILLALLFDAVFSSLIENGTLPLKARSQIKPAELIVPHVLDSDREEEFNNAYKIVFAGDLILLEDQVKRGLNEDGTYSFDDVFEYAKPYIDSADFAIGVFEGPMAGAELGYSEGNFDDNKELHLNFPNAFGESVRDSGFDLVTTAGNHILDRGEDGNLLTLNNLDEIGLAHTGTYSSAEDKAENNVYFVEQNGMTFAVLAYTYGINEYDTEELINSDLSYCTSFIYGTEGDVFETLKENVRLDFEKARSMNPDFIVVLPHYGTQFSNEPDQMQRVWNQVFKDFGADIILGDHPHVIEPAGITTDTSGHTVFEAYCPGNFANIYRDNQGDTSALIEVYIDKDTKEIIGGGIVPLYTQSPIDGNYRALPIYEVCHNEELRATLTTDDFDRAREANRIITRVVFGEVIDISSVEASYRFDNSGYLRPVTTGLELTDEMQNGLLWPLLRESNSICFLGDSVTEGSENNGCPWYEPMLEHLPGKTITNVSRGGCNVQYLIDYADVIPAADLYVIAIGTNDVRHRGDPSGAIDGADYVNKINELTTLLIAKNSQAKFVFIAPWYSTDGDTSTSLTYAEKLALNGEFSVSLADYCVSNGYTFIDVNDELKEIMDTELRSTYMVDFIHPNSRAGVILYCELVLLYT